MSNIETIVQALRDEFSEDVAFAAAPPSVFKPNSIVVLPDPENWLNPKSGGASVSTAKVREAWDILSVVSMENQAVGIEQMRTLSLRVLKAVSPKGAVWDGSNIQGVSGDNNKALVAAVSKFHFTYQASEQLPEEA